MTKRWTDEDVERLVEVVSRATEEAPDYFNLTGPEIKQALAPFRPDPEEELIEAMAKTYIDTCHHLTSNEILWEGKHDLAKATIRAAMRSTLAVIKEKGYFNDQR